MNRRLSIIGSGYVGLVSAACFAERGIDVTCVDVDQQKIDLLNRGIVPIYEPRLSEMVARNIDSGRLRFTTDISTVAQASIIFMAVGTPSLQEEGSVDLSYIYQAARDIAPYMSPSTIVSIKSTVPVGTVKEVSHIIQQLRPDIEFDVCSNPEFLREGSGVHDFMNPDRVVIGAERETVHSAMSALYQSAIGPDARIVCTTPQSSELIKYASNSFLAVKLAFINQIADLCEKTGADIQDVAKAVGLDKRISPYFLQAGPGFGGSCLPKDTKALIYMGKQYGASQDVVNAAVISNASRYPAMCEKIITSCGGDIKGKKIAVLGVAFKAGTDDMREAPSLYILPELQKAGAHIAAHDPHAMKQAAAMIHDVEWCQNPDDAIRNADVLVVLSECEEFRSLNLARTASLMRNQNICDLRNLLNAGDAIRAGFNYRAIGHTPVAPVNVRLALPNRTLG